MVGCSTLIVGCGASSGTVEGDPLTKSLGKSATTISRLGEQLDPQKLAAVQQPAEVRRANAVLDDAFNGSQKLTVDRLDEVLAEPGRPYAALRRLIRRFDRLREDLTAAEVSPRAFAESSSSIKRLLGAWNDYVGMLHSEVTQMRRALKAGIALEQPTTTFLQEVRRAMVTRDEAAYLAAKRRVEKAFRSSSVINDLAATKDDPSQEAWRNVISAANAEDDTKSLIGAVIKRYPDSEFARRLER